ncbi:DUF2589 domain-containing protein [Microbulbifer sediminum]|uniref:DUF2589 domain-containing protein n=1 Tax=Microbulbifer sediminum TaxID=2904250 RepID=UPI001F2DC636|nr:DUF2589 domain-containing protein [Microbulbifer sediminum]
MIKSVDFGQLVGAQVSALVEAELEAAQSTSDFIEAVGFDRKDDGSLSLRMVTFDMERRDSDGQVRTHSISIPALTLVPLPLLTVDTATIEFAAKVDQVTKVESKVESGSSSSGLPRLFSKKRRLSTRLARSNGKQTLEADMKVNVKLAQSALPLGIERLLNSADLSVQDETNET